MLAVVQMGTQERRYESHKGPLLQLISAVSPFQTYDLGTWVPRVKYESLKGPLLHLISASKPISCTSALHPVSLALQLSGLNLFVLSCLLCACVTHRQCYYFLLIMGAHLQKLNVRDKVKNQVFCCAECLIVQCKWRNTAKMREMYTVTPRLPNLQVVAYIDVTLLDNAGSISTACRLLWELCGNTENNDEDAAENADVHGCNLLMWLRFCKRAWAAVLK